MPRLSPPPAVQTDDQRLGAFRPTGAVIQSLWRPTAMSYLSILTSGQLFLVAADILPAGKTVTNITFVSGNNGATTPSNQWFCLVRRSDLEVLGKTADNTTTAWASQSTKTLALSTAYTATSDVAVYLGVLVVAATVPTLLGASMTSGTGGRSPTTGGNSTSGLTTPASLGANAAAITVGAGNEAAPFAWAT